MQETRRGREGRRRWRGVEEVEVEMKVEEEVEAEVRGDKFACLRYLFSLDLISAL